jgi:hypothetical protein
LEDSAVAVLFIEPMVKLFPPIVRLQTLANLRD